MHKYAFWDLFRNFNTPKLKMFSQSCYCLRKIHMYLVCIVYISHITIMLRNKWTCGNWTQHRVVSLMVILRSLVDYSWSAVYKKKTCICFFRNNHEVWFPQTMVKLCCRGCKQDTSINGIDLCNLQCSLDSLGMIIKLIKQLFLERLVGENVMPWC